MDFLAFAIGANGFFAIVAGVLALTVGLMTVYGLVAARAVGCVVLGLNFLFAQVEVPR